MKRSCATCGTSFETGGHGKRYCGPRCWPSRRPFADPEAMHTNGRTYEDLTRMLWTAARRGSVSAMVTLLKETKDRPDRAQGATSIVDELAGRRGAGQ